MFFNKNKKEEEKNNKKEEIIDFIKTTIIAASVMLFVRFFIIQPFYVKGSSMEPNFYENEYLIVDEISYRFTEPQRGDIVVFKYDKRIGREYLIKRVIGIPGDTVIVSDGNVIIKNNENPDGVELKEDYLPSGRKTEGTINEYVNEGSLFVLGDNRDASFDSRYFGSISRSAIVGKALLRGWPFNKFGIIEMGKY